MQEEPNRPVLDYSNNVRPPRQTVFLDSTLCFLGSAWAGALIVAVIGSVLAHPTDDFGDGIFAVLAAGVIVVATIVSSFILWLAISSSVQDAQHPRTVRPWKWFAMAGLIYAFVLAAMPITILADAPAESDPLPGLALMTVLLGTFIIPYISAVILTRKNSHS